MLELIWENSLFWMVLILNFIIFGISTSYVAGQKGKEKLPKKRIMKESTPIRVPRMKC